MPTDSSGAPALPASAAFSNAADGVTRAADDARFEQLLVAHTSAIRRLCVLYESDAAECDDLVQEIAFAIWRALPLFRGECSEKTFIYRIAHNRVLSHRFKKRIQAAPLSAADDVADQSANPAAAAERSSDRELLLNAVRRLPENLREPVVLRLEGLSDHEIADVLGLSEGNVAVRLTRARHALRAVLTQTSTKMQP
jgi:RNA polymerase sigma-70 factor (ECF subfamily)